MAGFRIRPYRDADYDVVREMYVSGFSEHLNALCVQALKQTWVQLVLVVFLLAAKAVSGSFLVSLMALIPLLVLAREGVRLLFNQQGIQLGLREDLLDIKASYMQEGQVSCFWVAEIHGRLVGTVGLLPCRSHTGAWELKRISVRKQFRRLGISKALCRTALGFAACGGVRDVVLYTSMLQTDAHKLYRSLGFHKIDEFVWPSLAAKLINFVVFKFGYKVQQREA
ncbi:probable N-acetyltransferase camello isoform X2 [Myripristis murdjan]|uniref:N-acetyltransferase domain-containing protein n=1 Tax=Myripristis murdjan TaxID=586833 RepID=A0A667YY55_9TELE|nr:N-acetyltransferase 8 isoform X2 [Myripristis murdjan]